MIEKKCFKCEVQKPLDMFYRHGGMADGHLNKCRACTIKDSLKRPKSEKDKQRSREYAREKYPENKEYSLAWQRAKRQETGKCSWTRALEKKASRPKPDACELCGDHKKLICWDHDHGTGLFRGWLCTTCNSGIGMLRDNATLIRRAAEYVENGGPSINPSVEDVNAVLSKL